MPSQIEIDGQDDGEEDDGAQDEDQDTILNDPVGEERERWREKEDKRKRALIVSTAQKSMHVIEYMPCIKNEFIFLTIFLTR